MAINYSFIFFHTLGGLGLFLYGLRFMSEGLQKIAGKKLREILNLLTKNRFLGVIIGAAVTGVIQSSSTMSVMVIGFVNAGLISLKKAISLIIGANIGTTITAQIIALPKISEFGLPMIGVGVLLYMFSKKRMYQYIGQTIMGFGLLFFGLSTMSAAFIGLKNDPAFANLFVLFSKNPFIAVLAGMVLTAIIQSSSATIGITIALANTGAIDFMAAFPLILGQNIGTTITAQLASIGTSITSRRTALAHTFFNVLGAAIFLVPFFIYIEGVPIFLYFIDKITPGAVFVDGANIDQHIANAHTFFNIICAIIFLPLIGGLAYIVTRLIPGEVEVLEFGPKYLDKRISELPSVAIGQAKKEVIRMLTIAYDMLELSVVGAFKVRKHNIKKVIEREKIVDDLQKEVIDFLVQLDEKELSENESQIHNCLMHLVNDVEKIGDYAVNIVQLVDMKVSEKVTFSVEALKDLRIMVNDVKKETKLSLQAFENHDLELANQAIELEGRVDMHKEEFRRRHIQRLRKKTCSSEAGVLFVDIINDFERIGDHAIKFAMWLRNPKIF
ncbi:Na/Pi cotransporter family protein [Candidatus Margulisiibacteriota bacterium]